MKTREQKQEDLNALTEQLSNSKSAMIVSFNKVTVNKDQEFRSQLREAGAKYQVVKNTIVRLAVKGTPYEDANEYFKGVTAIAWTENDPVVLSKAVSKFVKDNADIFTFKAGIVEGRVVDLGQVQEIASLPSKEELISKLLFVVNAQAQRIVTVINAVPRDLAIVIKQIGDAKPETPAAEQKAEAPAEQPQVEEAVKAEASAPAETIEQTAGQAGETNENSDAAQETAAAETEQSSEPVAEAQTSPEISEAVEQTPELAAETEAISDAALEVAPETEQSAAPQTPPAEEALPETEEKSE